MQTVYVLQSEKDGNLYVGCTKDMENRLNEHNQGLVRSTKNRRPFKLIFKELFTNPEEGFKMEQFYKTATGKRKLKEKLEIVFHK